MEFSLFEKIILKAKQNGATSVELYNWTEPFLHPDIKKFVNEVKKYELPLFLSSNLSLRSIPQLIDTLHAGVDILYVSVSGFTNKVHQINHVGSDINVVKKHLQTIAKERYNCKVIVKYLHFNYNSDEIEKFRKFAESLGLMFSISPGFAEPEKGTLVHPFDEKEVIVTPNTLKTRKFLNPCTLLFDSIPIDCRGNVYLCCDEGNYDIYKIGNFLEMDFSEIMLHRLFHPQCRICNKAERTKNEKYDDFRRPLKTDDISRITQWFENTLYNVDNRTFVSNIDSFDYEDSHRIKELVIFSPKEIEGKHIVKKNIDRIKQAGKSVYFTAVNTDPILILPEIVLDVESLKVVSLDIAVPSTMFIQLFYKTILDESYNEKNSIRLRLNSGRQHVYFNLEKIKAVGQLRIDPGAVKGIYCIHNIEIRRYDTSDSIL
jgi:hypothetical protein